jgi:hypothetical protein
MYNGAQAKELFENRYCSRFIFVFSHKLRRLIKCKNLFKRNKKAID